MTNFEKVGDFMKTFGQEVKVKSELSSEKINDLRISLINEELEELKKAIEEKNITEVADALTVYFMLHMELVTHLELILINVLMKFRSLI